MCEREVPVAARRKGGHVGCPEEARRSGGEGVSEVRGKGGGRRFCGRIAKQGVAGGKRRRTRGRRRAQRADESSRTRNI
eukprot:2591545-Pyramimonas_sp.AAC.1